MYIILFKYALSLVKQIELYNVNNALRRFSKILTLTIDNGDCIVQLHKT